MKKPPEILYPKTKVCNLNKIYFRNYCEDYIEYIMKKYCRRNLFGIDFIRSNKLFGFCDHINKRIKVSLNDETSFFSLIKFTGLLLHEAGHAILSPIYTIGRNKYLLGEDLAFNFGLLEDFGATRGLFNSVECDGFDKLSTLFIKDKPYNDPIGMLWYNGSRYPMWFRTNEEVRISYNMLGTRYIHEAIPELFGLPRNIYTIENFRVLVEERKIARFVSSYPRDRGYTYKEMMKIKDIK